NVASATHHPHRAVGSRLNAIRMRTRTSLAKQKAKAARQDASPPAPDRLEKLALAIDEVRQGTRNSPRTLKLLASGPAKMAQKVVEEAAEVAIEGAIGNRDALIHESVDLLYN